MSIQTLPWVTINRLWCLQLRLSSMAIRRENKVSMDVAADNSSGDSFSFAGLLCIQDQQHSKFHSSLVNPLPMINDAAPIQKQDTEFAFGHAMRGLAATDPNKNSPADLLFFNGELLPQAFPFQSNNSQVKTTGYTITKSPSLGQRIFSSLASPCKRCHAVEPSVKGQAIRGNAMKLQ